MLEKLPIIEDDGLITPDVGPWSEKKYRLVWNYSKMFATSMKIRWEVRVYIDLFAGAGHSRIEGTARIVPASPLLALNIKDRFDKYIFCEEDKEKIGALKKRVRRDYSKVDVAYVTGDANEKVGKILEEIPTPRKNYRVLSFCFVDPYKASNLKFSTIERLSTRYVDFLILIPSGMDINRNEETYANEDSTVIAEYTGNEDWRSEWTEAKKKRKKFGLCIADIFGRQMKQLDYIYEGLSAMEPVHHRGRRLLYHLAFFSRHSKGISFWKEARRYSIDQLKFPDMTG